MTEMDKLEQYLIENKIPYERRKRGPVSEFSLTHPSLKNIDVSQDQISVPSKVECKWDAICHPGSYGYDKGLLEIMGEIVSEDEEDVVGWLTADDVIKRIALKTTTVMKPDVDIC